MPASVLQLLGLVLVVAAGVMAGAAATVLAFGVVAVYVGIALERG